MSGVQIYATTMIAINAVVLGILLSESGQPKLYSYGERFLSWTLSMIACTVLFWLGGD